MSAYIINKNLFERNQGGGGAIIIIKQKWLSWISSEIAPFGTDGK